ncbi:MAG: YbgF trimerization domain-containing protein, partial [Gammaproteobacteria bacterium]
MPSWFTDARPKMLRRQAGGVGTALLLAAMPLAAQVSSERLERLERRVDRITELTLQIDQLRRESRELRGQIELQQHAIETLKRQQRDIYQDIDQRISQLQGAAPAAPPPAAAPVDTPGTPPAGQPPAPAATGDPAWEEAEYQAAYDLLRPDQRRYAEAVEAFGACLAKYPRGRYADNAQYWLAEANSVRQDNEAARTEFRKLL